MRERINLKSHISWPSNYIYCWMLAFRNIYMNKKTPYRVYVCYKRFSVIISICDVRFLDKALCNLHIRACMSECFISFMHASVCVPKVDHFIRLILHPRTFLSCYFHFTWILLFFFIPLKIFHLAITWVQNVCYENLCQIIVEKGYTCVYCVGIVGIWFCTGAKKNIYGLSE